MRLLNEILNDVLMLEKYDTNTLKCYIDVALPVHADMKIHT